MLKHSPLEAGLAFLAGSLGALAGSLVAQGLPTKVGIRPVALVGAVFLGAGLLRQTRLSVHASYLSDLLPAFALMEIGTGCLFVASSIGALAGVEEPEAGLASGLLNTLQQIGGAVGVAIVSTVAVSRTQHLLPGDGSPAAAERCAHRRLHVRLRRRAGLPGRSRERCAATPRQGRCDRRIGRGSARPGLGMSVPDKPARRGQTGPRLDRLGPMARLATLPLEPTEGPVIRAARAGDEAAFRQLTERYTRELHIHCYRMLGSLHDAEDLLQETLLLAWKRLDSFEGRASFRAWLYKIATNACLNELKRRPRQLPPRLHTPAADPRAEHTPYAAEVTHLEPYPDALYDELGSDAADPQARYLARETIELAFLTAIQLLPPRQRAVLILREVLGWSARETADLLDVTVPAVNSALQRARSTLAKHSPRTPDAVRMNSADPEAELLRRYMLAWEEADMRALAALLKEDALLTMPPSPSWYLGRDSIITFFSTSPYVFGDETRRLRLLRTQANRQPAFAAYSWSRDAAAFQAYGIMVIQLQDGLISEITGFADPSLFPFFGLPETVPA